MPNKISLEYVDKQLGKLFFTDVNSVPKQSKRFINKFAELLMEIRSADELEISIQDLYDFKEIIPDIIDDTIEPGLGIETVYDSGTRKLEISLDQDFTMQLVRDTPLTGLVSLSGSISAADTVLSAFGKVTNFMTTITTGFTPGQVLYGSSTGGIKGESGFFYDEALGYLGLGTDTPQTTIEAVRDGVSMIQRTTVSTGHASQRYLNDLNSVNRALEIGYGGSAFAGALLIGGIVGETAYIASTGNKSMQFGVNNRYAMSISHTSYNLLVGTLVDIGAGNKLQVGGNILPATTNTHTLGNASYVWNAIHATNITLPTFTQGSILFAGVGGIVSQSNANFFWDNTFRTLRLNQPSGSSTIISLDYAGVSRVSHRIDDSGIPHYDIIHKPATGSLRLWTAFTLRMEVTNTGVLNLYNPTPNTVFAHFKMSTGPGGIKFYESTVSGHPSIFLTNGSGTNTAVLTASGVSYFTGGNVIIGGTADNGNEFQVFGNQYVSGTLLVGVLKSGLGLELSHGMGNGIGFGFSTRSDSSATRSYTTGSGGSLWIFNGYAPVGGDGLYAGINLTGEINQTGGATGKVRGVYVNYTVTAAADFRAFESSNNTGWQFYAAGTSRSFFGGAFWVSTGANHQYNYAYADLSKDKFWQFGDTAARQAIGIKANTQNMYVYSLNGGAPNTLMVDYTTGWLSVGHTGVPLGTMHVKGNGGTVLAIDNSSNIRVFTLENDGRLWLGSTSHASDMYPTDGGTAIALSGEGWFIKNGMTSGQGYGYRFSNRQVGVSPGRTATGGVNGMFWLNEGFGPTSGTGTYAMLSLFPVINQTGGANGRTWALYINPTLTAAFNFVAIEVTVGKSIFKDVEVGSSDGFYLGDKDTDDTWRITRSGGNLVIERRELGAYVTKDTIFA